MTFVEIAIGQRFVFVKALYPRLCVKTGDTSYFENWGTFRHEPATENFFGGTDYLTPLDSLVIPEKQS